MRIFVAFLFCVIILGAVGQLTIQQMQPFFSGSTSSVQPPGDMFVWLKNESIVGSNNNDIVNVWFDSSGNGHHYGKQSSSLQITNNQVNGLPAAFGKAVGNYLAGTNSRAIFQNVDGGAIFMVVTNTSAGATLNENRTGTGSADRFTISYSDTTHYQIVARALDADVAALSAAIPVSRGFVLLEVMITYTNRNLLFVTNHVQATTSSTYTTANKTSNTASTQDPRLCEQGSPFVAGVAEYLAYSRPVTDAERTNQIEPYFKAKFNLW